MSEYQAVYDAVCQRIGHPDISGTVERVARESFDISWINSRALESIAVLEGDYRRPFVMLRPKMFPDGDKWCALYGENMMEGVAGFGDTPDAASWDFDKNWNGQKARGGKA